MPSPGAGSRLREHFAPEPSVSPLPPRFDVHVDAQRTTLQLVHPLGRSFGTVHELSLDLGRLASPVDLREGAWGLRNRRRRVLSARLWVSAEALEGWAKARCLTLSVDQASAEGVHVTFQDELGAVGVWLDLEVQGADLKLSPKVVRARSGAESPHARWQRAARMLGLSTETGPRLTGPLFWLLAEALLSSGQRAPEMEAMPPVSIEAGEGGFFFVAGAEADVRAPAPEASPQSIWPGSPAADALDDVPWIAHEAAFQQALNCADGVAAVAAVTAASSLDPSPGLWAEAARMVAGFAPPAVAADLLVRAAARAGGDASLLARAAERAASVGAPAVFSVVEAIDASPCSDTLRGELMAMALLPLLCPDEGEDAAPAIDLAESQLDHAAERALALAPHSPDVRLMVGAWAAQRGESAHALDHLRRAARGFLAASRPTSAAKASLRVAEVLDELDRQGAAERVLVDARAETDDAPLLLVALALRWAGAGLVPDALRAYAALLRQPGGRDGLAHALEQGARFALSQGNVAAAAPLVMRLLRDYPQRDVGKRLRARLDHLEADVSHVNGPWDPDDPGSA